MSTETKPKKNEVIEAKTQGLRMFLGSDQVQRALLAVLDDELRTRRFCRVLLTTCMANPEILECTQESVFGSIMEAAQLGLEIDGILGQAYLVPYKNNKAGTKEAVLIPGYKGLLKLVRNSGECKLESVECVYKDDQFRYAMGTSPFVEHVPKEVAYTDDRITHAYAIFRHSDGFQTSNVWTIDRIHAHKIRYAKGWQKPDSAWQTSFPAMAQKTVIRHTINSGRVPVSVEVQRLTMREAKLEAQQAADSKRIRSVDFGALGAIESLPAPSEEPTVNATPLGNKSHHTPPGMFRTMDIPPDLLDVLEKIAAKGDGSLLEEVRRDVLAGASEEQAALYIQAIDSCRAECERGKKEQKSLV